MRFSLLSRSSAEAVRAETAVRLADVSPLFVDFEVGLDIFGVKPGVATNMLSCDFAGFAGALCFGRSRGGPMMSSAVSHGRSGVVIGVGERFSLSGRLQLGVVVRNLR